MLLVERSAVHIFSRYPFVRIFALVHSFRHLLKMLHYVRMVSAFGFTLQVVYDISFIVNELDNLRPLNIIKHPRHDFIFRFKVIGVNVKGASFAVLQIKSPGWCP